MDPIIVDRKKLIFIVDDNRARHIQTYERALVGWRLKLIAALKKALKQARAGKQVMVGFPKPQSFVKEYDRVLGMLRMDQSASVKLNAQDFDRFVKDEWEWTDAFSNSAVGYAGFAKKLPVRRQR